ncbi:MAG: LysM peptidoglycan-binding domain-containing protein [Burkholderiales bacterium]
MKKAIISLILLLSFSVSAIAVTTSDLQPDAPDRHVVVPGDTLWGISTQFLKDPWRWPELWKMNQAQLRNPHRIYPGEVVVLERSSSGEVGLRVDKTAARVAPRVRSEAREPEPIRTIPTSAIEPFLSKPLVVTANELDKAPQIIATEEDRVVLGNGSMAYAQGVDKKDTRWQIYRRGDPLVDPETNQTLGYVAVYAGEAALVKPGDIATIQITSAAQEVLRGDKLLPLSEEVPVFAYVPHSPQTAVAGRIISTYGGLSESGPLAIVALSKGSRDGLEVGHVLALYRDQKSTRYDQRTQPLFGRQGPTGNEGRIPYYPSEITGRDAPLFKRPAPIRASDFAKLPSERYGLVMVFRTFDRASYALVMQASRPVGVSDIISNP